MNKVFIRTRQIDNNKQLPILIKENDDLSDFNEYSNISKSSQILSGMDKGEESEHHLQEVLRELQYEKTVFNKAIPIPEVIEEPTYENLYKKDFKLPKNYIRLKTLDFEDELPEYDIDEEDKEWLENSKLNVTPLKFEQIIEQFEKACCQKALLLDEAKSLLRHEAIHLVIAIYDYWLTKRVSTGQALILSVKPEKVERCNNTPIDPYIAFRKRSEKMTTRKNRRADEGSYEKMYRLRYQMEKLSEIIQLLSRREATKSKITQNERDIFVKRYEDRDYNKMQLKESESTIKRQSMKLGDFKSAQRSREENQKETKRKRSYSKSFETNQSSFEQQSEEIDFTFRPMSKCKYLPSRFATNDTISKESVQNSNPKYFSPSKLSYLPEPLQKINAPVRLRLNSNKMVSIDVQFAKTVTKNQRLHQPQLIPHSISDSIDCSSIDEINKSPSSSVTFEKYKPSSHLMIKLMNLYNRNVFCGLPPINHYLPDNNNNSANNRHISLSSLPSLSSSISSPAPPPTLIHYDSVSEPSAHIEFSTPNKSSNTSWNCLLPDKHSNHHQNGLRIPSQLRVNGAGSINSGIRYHSLEAECDINSNHKKFPTQFNNKISISNNNHNQNQNHNHSLSHNDHNINHNSTIDNRIFGQPKLSSQSHSMSLNNIIHTKNSNVSSLHLSHSKRFLSNHNNGTICTYQNYSCIKNNSDNLSSGVDGNGNTDTDIIDTYTNANVIHYNNNNGNNNNHSKLSNSKSKNCAFIESSDRRHISNGGGQHHRITTATKDLVESQTNHSLNGGFKNKFSKVDLQCLKTLTNNKRKDITEIASFYSKSNGHHQHSWLNQNHQSDNCLTSNLVMPLWKSEQTQVMTSVNKMT